MFVQYIPILPSNDNSKVDQMQRPLVLLHQTIDDAFKGKTQFLNGKLHNIAKALTDEDSDGSKREAPCYKKGMIFGLGLQVDKTGLKVAEKPITVPPISGNGLESKDPSNKIFAPLPANPSAYLSNFIIYIATIGDIFDGVDTTHNFNYFSLIYDWPKDLLTQLVFERGSTDAAEKAAVGVGVNFVHEIISSCVPPVFPPRSSHSWAWMPVYPTMSENNNSPKSEVSYKSALTTFQKPLYPLQLEILKTLDNLPPVRAVLAGVFGSSLIARDSEAERSFYEFALEQSERFPTLNRWIQVQSNLHRVSESALASKAGTEQKKERSHLKRLREPEPEPETKTSGSFKAETLSTGLEFNYLTSKEEFEVTDACFDQNTCISFDDDEGPYETAVEKAMTEQVALAASSNHVAQKTDKPLSVKLSDKASCGSNVKLTDWSPTTPFELDFSYLDVNSPKSPYTPEQNLKTELGSTELDFSYLNISSPKSRISHEKYHSKSGLEQGNSDCKHVHSQAEFRIDIPNVAPQNENECHRFYEEWVSTFSNGEETSSSETLADSIYISHMEKLEPLTTYVFGDQNPEMCSDLSHLSSSNISDLLELCRSSSLLGGCSLCNVELVEYRDIFIYMDKPFCSEECRDIFIEGESGYETMVDEEVPVAKLHKHNGPIFLPINE